MNKRKILLLASILVMVAILGVGGTLAYFTADDTATNTITVGNVKIDLEEPSWNEENAEDSYPGQVLPKDPEVENVGKNPCFIRIEATGWDSLIDAGLSEEKIKYSTAGEVDTLGEGWVEFDGYFYYMTAVEAGDKTTALFDEIVIPTDVVNDGSGDGYDIVITAHAVQSQGATFEDAEKPTVEELDAWFDLTFSVEEE